MVYDFTEGITKGLNVFLIMINFFWIETREDIAIMCKKMENGRASKFDLNARDFVLAFFDN